MTHFEDTNWPAISFLLRKVVCQLSCKDAPDSSLPLCLDTPWLLSEVRFYCTPTGSQFPLLWPLMLLWLQRLRKKARKTIQNIVPCHLIYETRMHSSRMRTVRRSSRLLGGGGGGGIPSCTEADPPMDRQDRCKNITFATSLRMVIKGLYRANLINTSNAIRILMKKYELLTESFSIGLPSRLVTYAWSLSWYLCLASLRCVSRDAIFNWDKAAATS